MLNLIIADDERIIRETISTSIPWEEYGIRLSGVCKNGMEVWDMILALRPDIVLTDIRMPGMDGLELIRRTGQAGFGTRFIILSGYGEFEYAREAMRYGVKYYLLKPCSESQILDCVNQCRQDCFVDRGSGIIQGSLREGDGQAAPDTERQFSAMTRQVIDYVNRNLQDEGLSLKYIAQNYLFMNVDYVSKKFLKETGIRFSAYLTDARIKKAKRLLAYGGLNKIQVVAREVGMGNNPQYFAHLFRKKTGMTPSAYAAKMAEGRNVPPGCE